MSLSARDRHALGSIQDQITGSDPQLASLMTMFTRLASGEEMPALEDIRAGGPRPPAHPAAGLASAPRGRALAPDATPGPNPTPSASRTGQPAFGHPYNQSRL